MEGRRKGRLIRGGGEGELPSRGGNERNRPGRKGRLILSSSERGKKGGGRSTIPSSRREK